MRNDEIIKYIRAGYAYFYMSSAEVPKACEDLADVIGNYRNGDEQPKYKVMVWDFERDPDPESCIGKLLDSDPYTVVIAKNLHWFLKDEYGQLNKTLVSILQNNAELFSSSQMRKVLVIVGAEDFSTAIPDVLVNDFLPLEYGLPTKEELQVIYDDIVRIASKNPKFVQPTETEKEISVLSLRGMTAREARNALAFAVIDGEGKIDPRTISRLRAKGIEKIAGISQLETDRTYDDIKGYEVVKDLVKGTLMGPHPEAAKGLMLVGPPGCGKTLFTQCVAGEAGMEAYIMELAQMMGEGLVGQAEKAMKAALDFVRANAPCVLLIDEAEKGLSGVGSSRGGTDGGTSDRSFGQLLKFLSDERPKGIYVLMTCNNIQGMPPEWLRAGRFDFAPIFIDLPTVPEQQAILDHYKKKFSVEGTPRNMEGWSGAEIEACCKSGFMMGRPLEEVEQFIIPISKTMGERIDALRRWAKDNTISASASVKPIVVSRERNVDF